MIKIRDEYRKRVISEGVFFDCLHLKTNAGYQVRRAKQFLLEFRGAICDVCKNTEWMGHPIPLTMDHKDGNPDNWNLENCRLICKNCDALQPTYCGKNKGKNKNKTVRNEYRKQRYKNGKRP